MEENKMSFSLRKKTTNSNRRSRITGLMGFTILTALLFTANAHAVVQSSANFTMNSNVLDSGGGSSSSANFQLNSSIGQSTPVGRAASANFGIISGFFPGSLAGAQKFLNDVVANLPSGVSIFFNNNSSSSVLHADTAEAVASGDVDNNGEDDVIASFLAGSGPGGTGGTFISRNQGALVLLDSKIAEQIAVGNFDGTDGADLFLDFGTDGLWFSLNDTAVTQLTAESPVTMAVGDTDNSGQDDVALSLNSAGTLVIRNFSVVDLLDGTPANVLELGDVDGNGEDDLFASFSAGQGPGGAGGLFASVNQGALFSLTPSEILSATSGDFDGSGQDDLLLDFGGATGLLVLFNGANVSPLGALPLVAATSGDVDNNGEDDMILSITGTGTIAFKNLTTVDTLDPAAATDLATGNVDGN
jgi:hypothetical protein